MIDVLQEFKERVGEIDAYLEFLSYCDAQLRDSLPRVGKTPVVISSMQQRVLHSSVYVQLYNLVESTINKCIESVWQAIHEGKWKPSDLSDKLRLEWISQKTKKNKILSHQDKLDNIIMDLLNHFIGGSPVGELQMGKWGRGNYDDKKICLLAKKLGCKLNIREDYKENIKRHVKNDWGPLKLIVEYRNDLAHGKISFAECGANVTVEDLRKITEDTANYLKEVVISFQLFVSSYEFLNSSSRPTRAGV